MTVEDSKPALVRCATCRSSLVQPGRTCLDCRRGAKESSSAERREKRQADDAKFKAGSLKITDKLAPSAMAAHRRVEGDGRRWR